MAVSKVAWIIVLVGAVIQLFTAYRMFVVKYPKFSVTYPDSAYLFLGISALYVIIGLLMIYAVSLMRKEEKCRFGSIFVIILGILGLNIVAVIGAIIGLVKSK